MSVSSSRLSKNIFESWQETTAVGTLLSLVDVVPGVGGSAWKPKLKERMRRILLLLGNLSALRAFLGPRARRPAVRTKACAGADNGCEKEDATLLAGLDAWLESDLMQMSLDAVGDYMVEGRNDEYGDDDKDEDEDDSDDDALVRECIFLHRAVSDTNTTLAVRLERRRLSPILFHRLPRSLYPFLHRRGVEATPRLAYVAVALHIRRPCSSVATMASGSSAWSIPRTGTHSPRCLPSRTARSPSR